MELSDRIQFEKMHAAAQEKTPSQTHTPVQSAYPQINAPSPQMSSGVTGSPHPKNAQQHHATPPFTKQPAQRQLKIQALDLRNSQLDMKINQLTGVTQHLKQRCDNLHTDEVVKQMVDQASIQFPHAKHYDQAVRELKNNHAFLNSRFNKLQQEKDQAVQELNALVAEADRNANTAKTDASAARGLNEKAAKVTEEADKMNKSLVSQVDAIKGSIDQLKVDAKKTSSTPTPTKGKSGGGGAEVESRAEALHQIRTTANDAHRRSRQLMQTLAEVKAEDVKKTLNDVQQKLDVHAKQLKRAEGEFNTTKSEIKVVKEGMGVQSGKVRALEHVLE